MHQPAGQFDDSQSAILNPQSVSDKYALNLTLKVGGMGCPSCASLIEEELKNTRGVIENKAFFLSDIVQIKYLPHYVQPQEIIGKIESLGYLASPFGDYMESSREKKALLLRLGISAFLTANIMMISLALYAGFFQDFPPGVIAYLSFPLWVLSTLVVFYGGFPILKKAYEGLRRGITSMETLISVGSLSAYLYSLIQMVKGNIHLYFDTAAMLVTLVLLGKYVEARAREKVAKGLAELYRLAHQKVRLWCSGRENWVTSEIVKEGEEFLVLNGESSPLDGRILSGEATVDESILTGEPKPLRKRIGDDILAGTILLKGDLKLRVTRVGSESSLGQMIQLIQEALNKKNPFEFFTDRIMRWIVPAVLTLAIGTASYLWYFGVSYDDALLRAIAILVITCPCALGIATPLAKVAFISVARTKGILIRELSALEQTKDINTFVFDKTGTMTTAIFTLREIVAYGISEDEALRRVASLEVHSDHFLAKEIQRKAQERSLKLDKSMRFETFDGLGVRGVVQGKEVVVGNERLMDKQGMKWPPGLQTEAAAREEKGSTVVFFAGDGLVHGFLCFGDSVKKNAQKTIRELQSRGIEIWMISGDSEATTRAVAKELGVSRFAGAALPADKVEIIKMLQQRGRQVGMVGDGINDAAALAQADVGIALGARLNIPQQASDISILSDEPKRVLEIIDLSSAALKTMQQNLFFAFFYNILAIPLAIIGLVNPLVAVFAMFASSLTVIGNTLRISRKQY